MNHTAATADRLTRLEGQARRLVERSPGNAAEYLTAFRVRLKAFEEGLVELEAGQSPQLLRDRIAAFEEAFAAADRCNRCGRALQTDESRKRGIGPDCWALLQQLDQLAVEGSPPNNEETP